MITVHHLNNSRSHRILWFLEELELKYDVVYYQRQSTLFAPPELKAIHPLGKSPVLTDGDLVIAESGAILEYLAHHYGKDKWVLDPGSAAGLRCTYWLHYAEGSAMLPLLLQLVFNRIEKAPLPFYVKPIAKKISQNVKQVLIDPQLKTHLNYIELELGKNPWFAGEQFSIADIHMSFPIELFQSRAGLGATEPHCLNWLTQIHQRPAYQRALARGETPDTP